MVGENRQILRGVVAVHQRHGHKETSSIIASAILHPPTHYVILKT